MRVNIFPNGDIMRQNGRVVIVEQQQFWSQFINQCLQKLQLGNYSGACIYTRQGGLIESIDELIQDDVLFVAARGEPFIYNESAAAIVKDENENCTQGEQQQNEFINAQINVNEELIKTILVHVKQVSDSTNESSAIKEALIFKTDLNHHKTIMSLKKWLCKKTGYHCDDISLIQRGRLLRDEELVNEIAMSTEDTQDSDRINVSIFMLVKPLVLYIKLLRGGASTLVIQQSSDFISQKSLVRDVKSILSKKWGRDDLKLMFNQKQLCDGEQLSSYGVMSGAVLYAL